MENLQHTLEQHALWLQDSTKGERADLYGANLSGADLYGANLSEADLREADLRKADLSGADLSGANLYGAYLSGANLYGANLSKADLSKADLCKADLSGADLREAYLRGAYLRGADLNWAKGIISFQKSGGRICYAVEHATCLMIKAGCFWGTLAEFEAKALEAYPNDSVQAYSTQIAYLKTLQKHA